MLRRIFLAVVLVVGIVATPGVASAHHANKECPQHWWVGPWHVKQMIKCAANAENVNVDTALRVADCESDFDPSTYYNGNGGVYQHRIKYWASRASTYGFKGWSVYNGRANIYVTMRMVNDTGWSPWSCY